MNESARRAIAYRIDVLEMELDNQHRVASDTKEILERVRSNIAHMEAEVAELTETLA